MVVYCCSLYHAQHAVHRLAGGRLLKRMYDAPLKHCLLLQERKSAATNGNGGEHGSNGVSQEESKQKALDAMAAASSDSDFEKLLSEVKPAWRTCPKHCRGGAPQGSVPKRPGTGTAKMPSPALHVGMH